jgi:hypothetical protein
MTVVGLACVCHAQCLVVWNVAKSWSCLSSCSICVCGPAVLSTMPVYVINASHVAVICVSQQLQCPGQHEHPVQ